MSLKWKKKWLDDKSGYWYSTKIPVIGWEYIIDVYEEDNNFKTSLFLSKTDSDTIKIGKGDYKTKDAAKKACEKHLQSTFKKFQKALTRKHE